MPVMVVMGVSGAGKSTIGLALAERLGLDFVEGDAFHPPENVARMAAGEPLDDAARRAWLDALGAAVRQRAAHGSGAVVTCSALRRSYRDELRAAGVDRFVFLDPARDELGRRLRSRRHEFMPPTLLDSQLTTLERPDDEPDVVVVAPAERVAETVERVVEALGAAE